MFWKDFNQNVSEVKEKRTREVLDLLNDSLGSLIFDRDKDGNIDRKCQLCNDGSLSLKNSFRGGAFIGCSNYPECKFTRPLIKSKSSCSITTSWTKSLLENMKMVMICILKMEDLVHIFNMKKLKKLKKKLLTKKKRKKKKKSDKEENNFKNVSIPKGITLDSIDLDRAKFLCSLPKH